MMGQPEQRLEGIAEAAVRGLSVRRLVEVLTFFMKRAEWGWRALVFSGLILVASIGIGRLIGEAAALDGVKLWAAVLLVVALLSYERLGRRVVEILGSDIAPGLPNEVVEHAAQVVVQSKLLRRQTLFSAGIGGLTALLLGPALIATFGWAPVMVVVVIVGSALTANYVYVPAMASVLALLLARDNVPVFPLDPLRSRTARGLETIGRETVWTTAALATVGVVGPLLVPGLGIVGLVLALLVFSGAVLATAAQYIVQVVALNRLVGNRREATLNALQHELDEVYLRRNQISSDGAVRAGLLLAMHDQAARARENALSPGEALGFISPLILPLIGLVLGSLNLPWLNEGLIDFVVDVLF